MSQCENCADLQRERDDAVAHAAEAERRASEAEGALADEFGNELPEDEFADALIFLVNAVREKDANDQA